MIIEYHEDAFFSLLSNLFNPGQSACSCSGLPLACLSCDHHHMEHTCNSVEDIWYLLGDTQCVSLLPIAVINTIPGVYHNTGSTSNLEREGYISSSILESVMKRKVRVGTQGRNPEIRAEVEVIEEHCLLACSVTFLYI